MVSLGEFWLVELMFEYLASSLSNVFLCKDEADTRTWMSCLSRVFSTKSFYRSLKTVRGSFSSSILWHSLALPTVEVFC